MTFYRFRSPLPVLLPVAILSLFLLSSCTTQKTQAGNGPARSIPVTVAQADRRDIPVVITAIGNVTPLQTVQVKSMVTAQIVKVHFTAGQDLQKGQLLFTLDARTFQADLAKAEGQLARDRAAAANARASQKRYQALLKEGVVAQQQYDELESTASQYDAAVEADKASVESARVNLQYTKIYSPIAGRAGDVLMHEGNLMKANDLAMVVINQISPIYTDFSIPEHFLSDIKKYMAAGTLKVVATLPDSSAPLAQGKVAFIDNMVDRATGTIVMKAEFGNQQRTLWPGQFVNINLQLTTEKNATVVPSQAVQNGQSGTYVFVVKPDKTVESRLVDVGPSDKGLVVIHKGIEVGETVVTDGQVRIAPGSTVEWKASEAPPQGKQS
jgi:membrane fusion protein, multidrug efflux system